MVTCFEGSFLCVRLESRVQRFSVEGLGAFWIVIVEMSRSSETWDRKEWEHQVGSGRGLRAEHVSLRALSYKLKIFLARVCWHRSQIYHTVYQQHSESILARHHRHQIPDGLVGTVAGPASRYRVWSVRKIKNTEFLLTNPYMLNPD